MGIVMCMLCLDTSLKAIHNVAGEAVVAGPNVYAMLRYKFESNSQLAGTNDGILVECVCYA